MRLDFKAVDRLVSLAEKILRKDVIHAVACCSQLLSRSVAKSSMENRKRPIMGSLSRKKNLNKFKLAANLHAGKEAITSLLCSSGKSTLSVRHIYSSKAQTYTKTNSLERREHKLRMPKDCPSPRKQLNMQLSVQQLKALATTPGLFPICP